MIIKHTCVLYCAMNIKIGAGPKIKTFLAKLSSSEYHATKIWDKTHNQGYHGKLFGIN